MDNKITVVVADRTYILTSPDQPEYVQKVANYVDEQVKKLAEASHASTLDAGLMTALNIADGSFKEQEAAEHLRRQVKQYADESGKLKQEAADLRRELLRLQPKNQQQGGQNPTGQNNQKR